MSSMLVLQFSARTLSDYDNLVALEDRISRAISTEDEVDGHDFGDTEMNIFIVTESPRDTFERVKSAIPELITQNDFKAAFRDVNGAEYTILWPRTLTNFSVR